MSLAQAINKQIKFLVDIKANLSCIFKKNYRTPKYIKLKST